MPTHGIVMQDTLVVVHREPSWLPAFEGVGPLVQLSFQRPEKTKGNRETERERQRQREAGRQGNAHTKKWKTQREREAETERKEVEKRKIRRKEG